MTSALFPSLTHLFPSFEAGKSPDISFWQSVLLSSGRECLAVSSLVILLPHFAKGESRGVGIIYATRGLDFRYAREENPN